MDTDALQRLDAFLSDPKVPQEDKNRAVAMARTQEQAGGTWYGRAGGYIARKAGEWQQAADTMLGGLSGYGPPEHPPSSALDVLGQTATALAPAVAPGLTALGTAAGAGTRALGADESTADLANVGTQLVGGGVQALRGIAGVVRGVRATREAARLAAEANVTTARGGLQAAKDAAQAARTAVPEGQQLGAAVPGMRQATAAARGALFDPIIGRLTALGRTVQAGTPEGDRLAQALLDAQDEWGPVAGGAEKSTIRDILGKLRPATPSPVETGVLDESGQMLMRTPEASRGAVTAQELDDALKVLNKSGKGFAARRALVQATNDLAAGTDVEGALTSAGREYHATIKPGQYFARQIATAGTPGQATARAIRLWNQMAPETQALVDPQGDIGAMVGKAQQVIRGVGTATENLRSATTAARTAGKAASLSGRAVAGLGVGSVVAIPRAMQRFQHGDIRGGMEQLLIGTGIGAAVGIGGTAALRGAAGPLARTAVAVGGQIPGLAGAADQGYVPDTSASPEAQPTPAGAGAPQQPTREPLRPLPGPFGRELAAVSALVGVPAPLIQRTMLRESSGDPTAAAGSARGLMQVKPGTFAMVAPQLRDMLGRKPQLENPLDNLLAGGLIMRQALDKTNGDVKAAARLYTAGLNATQFTPGQMRYGDDIAGSIEPQAFVFHHSGGSTLQGLAATLQQRGLGAEYLMDRDGSIYPFSGPGARQIEPNDRWGGAAPGLTNANSVGMEVVARDNRDITPAQIAAARRFIQDRYPNTPVFGHGEVNPGHKQRDEGMAIVNAIRQDRAGG
jgi:hypothetical protein